MSKIDLTNQERNHIGNSLLLCVDILMAEKQVQTWLVIVH
jgi:hypothetical protein